MMTIIKILEQLPPKHYLKLKADFAMFVVQKLD